MIIKIMGGALTILSGAIIGLYFAHRDGFRAGALLEIKKALIELTSEIEYSLSSLPEALTNVAGRRGQRAVNLLFAEAGKRLSAGGTSVSEAWEAALRSAFAGTSLLTPEDTENIAALGRSLGRADRGLQIKSIALTEDYIDARLSELAETSAKNKRLYSGLGVLAGLLAVIVML